MNTHLTACETAFEDPLESSGVSLLASAIVPSSASVAGGTGLLRLARIGPRTVLQRVFATSPLRFLNPRTSDRAAWVYSATYGGGLVGGDTIRMTVDMQPGARAVLATQSSTKIYRSTRLASQHLTACVNDDGLLVVAPDPTVCFARSSFRQRQCYELSRNANVVVIDWMTSGRRAMGERWAFDRYDGRLELRRAGRTILYDSLRLTQDDGPIAGRMGRFNVWATVVLSGPLLAEAAASLMSEIANLPVPQRSDLILSAAPLGEDGLLLRMAGLSTEQVSALIRQHLSFLAPHLGGELWSRKW